VEPLTRFADIRSPEDVFSFLVTLFTYRIPISAGGELSISVRSLLIAIVVFVVIYRLSRTAQRFLRGRVLSHVPIDPGLSYTLERLVHYSIIAIGLLVALRIGVGVDLTSIAVIVTALSVGIGLGLKEISGDVAAGFVLLFERPLRVGDRVKLSGGLQIEGDVVGIDLRTTKIRTLDRQTVIIPNSKLTNDVYVNTTYRDGPLRVRVPIGVVYESDVGAVRRALLDAAREVDAVLDDPPADVVFIAFGESTLDFELDAWTNEQKRATWVRSEINFKVDEKFRAAGIEMRSTEQDINIRTIRGLPRAS
jgi:small-conductance mechanosensitive channel